MSNRNKLRQWWRGLLMNIGEWLVNANSPTTTTWKDSSPELSNCRCHLMTDAFETSATDESSEDCIVSTTGASFQMEANDNPEAIYVDFLGLRHEFRKPFLAELITEMAFGTFCALIPIVVVRKYTMEQYRDTGVIGIVEISAFPCVEILPSDNYKKVLEGEMVLLRSFMEDTNDET